MGITARYDWSDSIGLGLQVKRGFFSSVSVIYFFRVTMFLFNELVYDDNLFSILGKSF